MSRFMLDAWTGRIGRVLARRVRVKPVVSKLQAPLASISFDDIPASAARVGAPILEAAGLHGTFYVCGKHAGERFEDRQQHEIADLIALHAGGHELACHSFAHPDVTRLNKSARDTDRLANQAFMREKVADHALTSFAYPYGSMSLSAKAYYGRHFTTCRGVVGGVNAGVMDFSDLKAVGIENRHHDMGRVRALIDTARAQNGWLIFFTHDVSPQPSAYGCTPKDLEDVITALADAKVTTMPVKTAAQCVLTGEST
jgi:peptidoglycan/xylan/chitin deacetylase (PgdA/CDA1 family)